MSEKYPTKKQWGPGPWQGEPDELHWVDEVTSYKCHILRAMPHTGALNGYVAVPDTHPACNMSYNGDTYVEHEERMAAFREELQRTKGDINKWRPAPEWKAFPGIGEAIEKIEVHGGLTYAGPGIPVAFKDEWWFGFDCAHAFDLCPAIDATMHLIYIEQNETKKWEARQAAKAKFGPEWQDTYRTIDYVRQEVTELALQLKALEVAVDVASYTSNRSE